MIDLEDDFLRGSYTPLVTPFRGGEVDYDTYATLVERQISGGSHGITVNGTSAEPSTLTERERDELVRVAVETAGGRVPVVAATGSQSHAETVRLTVHAAAVGADAALVVTPYFIGPPERGLVEYFRDVGARTDLPLLVHHAPAWTAADVSPAAVEQIAEVVPTFAGVQHESGDLGWITDVRRRLDDDVRVFAGVDGLGLPMLAVGASGLMSPLGNVAPMEVAALYESVAAGDLEAARKQHDGLFELHDALSWDADPVPVKYMMCRLGLLPVNEHRLPMLPAAPELERRLDDLLARSGLV